MTTYESYFVTCAKGTELLLKDELRELGLHKVRADRGGVRFAGTKRDGLYACLHTRIGVRVLWVVSTFSANDQDSLYEGTRSYPWESILTARQTLSVSAASKSSALTHTNFIAQRIKDGIVDRLRMLAGERPSVDREDADLMVFAHLKKDECTLYLDVGGGSLHRRGWRREIGGAPLKETLAAAMLRASGWDRQSPLRDPMCGSGTIVIEADQWARNIAPNILRERFGAERWCSHDEHERRTMKELRQEARDRALGGVLEIEGFDSDPEMVEIARLGAQRAGANIRFSRRRLRDFTASSPGWMVSNPPFGVRLDGERAMWEELGEVVSSIRKHRLALLLSSPPPSALLPPPHTLVPLWNGPIECRFAVWNL